MHYLTTCTYCICILIFLKLTFFVDDDDSKIFSVKVVRTRHQDVCSICIISDFLLIKLTFMTEAHVTLNDLIGDTSHITCETSSFVLHNLTIQCWIYYNPKVVQKTPIIVIHGGPAFTHNYLLPLKVNNYNINSSIY